MATDTTKQNTQAQSTPAQVVGAAYLLLSKPRITEKATTLATVENTYVFDVAPEANKIAVKKAVQELYNVVPVKVNMVTVPKKAVFMKRIKGMKGGGKKAYVTLKKGDTIEIA